MALYYNVNTGSIRLSIFNAHNPQVDVGSFIESTASMYRPDATTTEDMDTWGPAIDALGQLPNVYMKMGATEQWEVEDPGSMLF